MVYDIKELQNKILEIVVYIDEFCNKYDIQYYLMGGSALGAIRHKGFIPWDDDLDIFMTYDNYIRFIECCENYLDTEKFYLQKENTEEWPMFFSKIRMNGTTFIEKDTKDRDMHKGIYVDVMCLNNVSKIKIIRYIQYVSARILTASTLSKNGYITNSKLKKASIKISDFLITEDIKNLLLKIVRFKNNSKANYVGHFFGRAKFKNTSFPKNYLGNSRYVKFENVKLPVMQEVEKYLELRYGEKYMELPSEEVKKMYPSHAYIVDLNEDYTKYNEKF